MQKTYRDKLYCALKGRGLSLLLSAFTILNVNCCIYDDLDDCPQGINVHFYSKTPCDNDTVYPQLSELKLFVFDQDGYLASFRDAGRDEIHSHYSKPLAAKNGWFSVVAWGGLSEEVFKLSNLDVGVTTKNDLLFTIQRTAALQAAALEERRVYYGESPAVFLPDPAEYGSVFETALINLQEATNRLTVQVDGLPRNDDYEVVVESANGSMNIDGSIAPDQVIGYTAEPEFDDNDVLEAKLTVLKLIAGDNTTLIIRDKGNDQEIYRVDLLDTLLLKNPEVNLACDHDFTIRFATANRRVNETETYMVTEIWVNNWLVHSFNTDL